MPKTKRELILTLSDKIGGERGQRMRTAFEGSFLKDLKAWDTVLSDEDFDTQLKKLERAVFLKINGELQNPGSWGLPN